MGLPSGAQRQCRKKIASSFFRSESFFLHRRRRLKARPKGGIGCRISGFPGLIRCEGAVKRFWFVQCMTDLIILSSTKKSLENSNQQLTSPSLYFNANKMARTVPDLAPPCPPETGKRLQKALRCSSSADLPIEASADVVARLLLVRFPDDDVGDLPRPEV